MKYAIVLVALLSGCATTDLTLANRVTCAVARDKAFVVSEWGPIGISSVIAEQDRKVICGGGQ